MLQRRGTKFANLQATNTRIISAISDKFTRHFHSYLPRLAAISNFDVQPISQTRQMFIWRETELFVEQHTLL